MNELRTQPFRLLAESSSWQRGNPEPLRSGRLHLNGQAVEAALSLEIKDGDMLLLSYGRQDLVDKELEEVADPKTVNLDPNE